jgi:hypothetical protein
VSVSRFYKMIVVLLKIRTMYGLARSISDASDTVAAGQLPAGYRNAHPFLNRVS